MRLLARLLCIVTQAAWTVNANVEKTIFLAPSPVTLDDARPGLDDVHVRVLSPSHTILSTHIPVRFPTHALPRGLESWYLLRGLAQGQRYEVRICWPATQPTDFWLDTHKVTDVFDTPDLIASLDQYSKQRQAHQLDSRQSIQQAGSTAPESVLFLRLHAAASYYSTNRTLMDYPPPVDVDLILDPFLLNVFPQSLGPVAIYITVVAVAAWFLSGYIYRWLLQVANEPPSKPHTD